jgi:ParB family chromosome partitioning protein
VVQKLQAEPEVLVSEGWKRIEGATDLPYGCSHGLWGLFGYPATMSYAESAAHASLLVEYRALEEEYSRHDEYPEDTNTRLGQLKVALEALKQRPLADDEAEIARAWAFVTLNRVGSLAVYRGYVRPEDEPREESAVHDGDGAAALGRTGPIMCAM